MTRMEIAQAIFHDFTENQSIEILLANVTDDVTLENSAPDVIPFGGEFHGRSGILDYFSKVSTVLEAHSVHVTGFFEGEDSVVILGDEMLRILANGSEAFSLWCTVLTFRGSRIVRATVIEDHTPLALALSTNR